MDYKTAQKLLGHAQLSTTMDICTDVLDDTLDEATSKMDGVTVFTPVYFGAFPC